MVTVNNINFVKKVESHSDKQSRIAIKAGSSPQVLEKLLDGRTDFSLAAAGKIADYLGFDLVVEFVPRDQVS